MNEFENYVNELEGTEEAFNLNGALAEKEAEQPSLDGEKPQEIEDNNPDEKDLPFNKNPKVLKFIDREIKKRIGELHIPGEQIVEKSREDVPPEWIAMYGDNEDTRKAWGYQSQLMKRFKDEAKQEALQQIQQEQDNEDAEVAQYENYIEDSLDDIEEQYGVDLSSRAGQARRTEFLDLVQRLSPKDKDGNVTSFADFHSVWEIFNQKAPNQTIARQKDLAARSTSKTTEVTAAPKGYEAGMGADGVRRAIGLE